jgi:hypothetical protein
MLESKRCGMTGRYRLGEDQTQNRLAMIIIKREKKKMERKKLRERQAHRSKNPLLNQ